MFGLVNGQKIDDSKWEIIENFCKEAEVSHINFRIKCIAKLVGCNVVKMKRYIYF